MTAPRVGRPGSTAELLADAAVREAALALRPHSAPEETVARAAWSVLTEPGDGVAGVLVQELGAAGALDLVLSEVPRETAAPSVGRRSLAEGLNRWRLRGDFTTISASLTDALDVSARMLLPGDPEWPEGLADLGPHGPHVLWVRGDPSVLGRTATVSIVGARASTGYGEQIAAELSGDLAGSGTVVVSGGAYGIDGAAHRAALGVGGATVAFLAGGVDRWYPSGHHRLFERICASGAVVSEVPCGAAPTRWRFLERNRLIAATGRATVVVEAGWRSGTLNTAGHAATLGRPLGAVPGPVSSASSAGCHRLLREYDAVCVTRAAEVRELWGEGAAEPLAEERHDPDRIRLLDALSTRAPRESTELARRSGLPAERVRGLLGMLDLEGVVTRRDPGWIRLR
ncbi:MAG: DNA-processing protein DprA [Microbacterium sp.]